MWHIYLKTAVSIMCMTEFGHFRQKGDLPQTEPVPHCQGAGTAPLRSLAFPLLQNYKFKITDPHFHTATK